MQAIYLMKGWELDPLKSPSKLTGNTSSGKWSRKRTQDKVSRSTGHGGIMNEYHNRCSAHRVAQIIKNTVEDAFLSTKCNEV